MNDHLLALENISFDYGPDAPVLQNLDFSLAPGERVVLTGSNGSGKTTLLHLIMGLVRPRLGRIVVLGKPRSNEADFREVRQKVGLLFQDSDDQLFCPTVLEDVAFGPLNLGMKAEDVQRTVAETLHLLGLDGYQDRVTYRLSYGEKKMVALATILAMQPRVLLLDEPTAGLDERHEARLTSVLQELPQEMIVVTHNRSFLERIATRVLHLSNGRVVEEETVDRG